MNHPQIETLHSQNQQSALAYLETHEESSQFLINNLKQYGPTLTDHHNSGNYKILRGPNGIEGVFCLTRRGNVLVQTEADYSDLILQTCQQEPVALKGFIGAWKSVEPIWQKFKRQNPSYRPSYESKEILYSLSLSANDSKLKHDSRVRFLEIKDFMQWNAFSTAYMKELQLPDDLDESTKRKNFEESIVKRICWGLFLGDELISRTALNSNGEKIGQVGGVFTPKEKRQKGYGKATMLHMLRDCRDIHGHTKSILFTGEADIPAQKLYESIGYKRIGSFALILG